MTDGPLFLVPPLVLGKVCGHFVHGRCGQLAPLPVDGRGSWRLGRGILTPGAGRRYRRPFGLRGITSPLEGLLALARTFGRRGAMVGAGAALPSTHQPEVYSGRTVRPTSRTREKTVGFTVPRAPAAPRAL
jgi:hypothetical protein